MKMKLKKGDTVMVISGKDKGKQGTILHAYPMTGKVLVEGMAMYKKSIRASQGQSGSIVEKPRAIDASNVMFFDAKEKKGSRIGRRVENGKVVRFSKKSSTTLS
jgi:large subunit ribosomal protein L24